MWDYAVDQVLARGGHFNMYLWCKHTYVRNKHEVEVVVTDSVNIVFLVYILPGMIFLMCYTWYVFVVALKVKKVSSAQNRGLPTNFFF